MATSTNADQSGGIRAVVSVGSPGGCPAAAASEAAGGTVSEVNRSVRTDGCVVEDFTVDAPDRIDDEGLSEVYRMGHRRTYRFTRETEAPCVCEAVEELGVPLADIRARAGTLELTFFADDVDVVRDAVSRLRGEFDDVSVRYLSQAGEGGSRDLVMVDRDRLTARQREVLETAYEMGYFDYPKGANAATVSAELGIATSTFIEHMSAAQSKVLEAVLHS
ncbi:MAG: helix-turn-helix domain-containing protein [Haloferacaceae archaeon]